jgi:hypothetical protein
MLIDDPKLYLLKAEGESRWDTSGSGLPRQHSPLTSPITTIDRRMVTLLCTQQRNLASAFLIST